MKVSSVQPSSRKRIVTLQSQENGREGEWESRVVLLKLGPSQSVLEESQRMKTVRRAIDLGSRGEGGRGTATLRGGGTQERQESTL